MFFTLFTFRNGFGDCDLFACIVLIFLSSKFLESFILTDDTDFLIDECKKANEISKYIQSIDSDRKQAVLQALLEVPETRVQACWMMGGHQKDKNCKCTRCGYIEHDWKLINPFSEATEEYQCRNCGAIEIYQL